VGLGQATSARLLGTDVEQSLRAVEVSHHALDLALDDLQWGTILPPTCCFTLDVTPGQRIWCLPPADPGLA
jgi:hypothetical protein